MGFFLHVPWPSKEVLMTLPEHKEIVESLLKISTKSGIGKAKAISCLEDQEKALDLVNEFQFYVNKDAIESTPTFIINGNKYTNRSYDELKKIIDKELAN